MTTVNFTVENPTDLKQKMLNWANQFNIFCLMDNNAYSYDNPAFECILAAGCKRSVQLDKGHSFTALKDFYESKPGWLFGHLGYDLKNEVEDLTSRCEPLVDFGIGFFFEPTIVVRVQKNELSITCEGQEHQGIRQAIQNMPAKISSNVSTEVKLKSQITEAAYVDAVNALKEHIRRGDCYEINFCQQYFAQKAIIDPLYTYGKLLQHSPNPFAAFYKLQDKYCLCASPERYLKKTGKRLLSQPIKGTSKRHLDNAVKDMASMTTLQNSIKERSENVMVVDLVRNDLSRISKEGSVQVAELYGIYSFPQVHQMISSVKSELEDGLHWTDAIKATFPMGSMTGAPKKRVMELIDEYETAGRGLFSGSIGYITPEADFDFNVVIRSIFYDKAERNLSYSVGSAITFASNALEEYHETLLKAEAIMTVLGANDRSEEADKTV